MDASVGALGLYQVCAEWRNKELVTREVRVEAVRFSPDGKRVTVRLLDFPQWRVGDIVWRGTRGPASGWHD